MESQNASGVFPLDSTVVHPAVNIEDKLYNMEEAPVLEPLEHLNCVVTDHVDIDTFWRTVFRWVARLSCQPTFVQEDCSRLFRSLGRMCVLDVLDVGQTDVPTGRQGDVPRRSLPPSPMSLGDGEMSLSLLVALMGKSSRRSGLTEMGHSPGMVRTTAMYPDGCYPG